MSWYWVSACTFTFALVLMRAESEGSESGPEMYQRELDLSDLWKPIDFPSELQREAVPPLNPDVIRALKEKDRPLFGPRSFGPQSSEPPRVQFPPAQPSVNNLQAICVHGNQRPRYPAEALPQTGFGYLRRQGDSINLVESRYSVCCVENWSQNQEMTLCCVIQAWEETLEQFCSVEFSIKTRHYHCCKKEGEARLRCFHGESSNPAYRGPKLTQQLDPVFTYNRNTCQRSELVPRSSQGERKRNPVLTTSRDADINFPPGQPIEDPYGPGLMQRELTIEEIMRELPGEMQKKVIPHLDPDFIRTLKEKDSESGPEMYQREVDLSDAWEPIDFPCELQREEVPRLDPDVIRALKEKDRPLFGPRSFGPRSSEPPQVEFPPAQPSVNNLQAICVHGNQRPRYPAEALPQTGFGYLRRQGDSINLVESRYSVCCAGNWSQNQEMTLCCVIQAWEETLEQFCSVEFSIKTRHYHCCKKEGEARLRCFHGESSNPAYRGPKLTQQPDPVFTYNRNTCQRSELVPRSSQGEKKRKPVLTTSRNADINFPPGRPTAGNIEMVCRFRKLRPLYRPRCLPRAGFIWLAQQSKAINRLEQGFKNCCNRKGDMLRCADGKWCEVMDKFCEEEGKSSRFSCCEMVQGEERYGCFSARAPQPGYDMELNSTSQTAPQEPTLSHICETHKIIRKKFNVGFNVQTLVSQCCALPENQRITCVQEKLGSLSEDLCSGTMPVPSSVRQCCSSASQDSPTCFSSLIMDAITQATQSLRLRKRKCPLS